MKGLTQADYQQWRQHPVSRWFRQYLADAGEAIKQDHLTRFIQGDMDPAIEAEARGRMLVLNEIATMEFGHIAAFYNVPMPEQPQGPEEDEIETDEN